MKINHLNKALLSAACGLLLLCGESQGVLIGPGGFTGAPPEPDPIGGAVLFSTNVSWGASFSFSGTLTSTVLLGDAGNTNGAGALTFTYLFTIDGSSAHPASGIAIGDFAGFLTDVSYQSPGVGTPPTFITRSSGSGANVRFNFASPDVPPGGFSALLVVQTDSTAWDLSIASIINSSAFPDITTVAPANAIPEPASAGLVLLGMGAVAWFQRRKQSRG